MGKVESTNGYSGLAMLTRAHMHYRQQPNITMSVWPQAHHFIHCIHWYTLYTKRPQDMERFKQFQVICMKKLFWF